MGPNNEMVPQHRDDGAQADTASSPSEPPSLDALTADVRRALAAFDTLSPDQLRTATTKVRMLANVAEAMARRREC